MRVTVVDPVEVVRVRRVEDVGTIYGGDGVVVPENKRVLQQAGAERLRPGEVDVVGKTRRTFHPVDLETVVVGVTDVLIDVNAVGAIRGSKGTVVRLFVVRSALGEVLWVGGF